MRELIDESEVREEMRKRERWELEVMRGERKKSKIIDTQATVTV